MKATLPIVLALLACPAGIVHALDLQFVQPRPASRQMLHLSDQEMTFQPLPDRNVDTFKPAAPFYGREPEPMPGLTVTIQSGTATRRPGHAGTMMIPLTVTLTNGLPFAACFVEPPVTHLWLYSIRTPIPNPLTPNIPYLNIGRSYVQVDLSKPKRWDDQTTWIGSGKTYVLIANRTIKLNSKIDTRLIAEITVDALLPNNVIMLLHTFSTPYQVPPPASSPAVQVTP